MSDEMILVTGGAGYIGSHAVHRLLDAQYRPVVLDDFSTGRRVLLPDEAIVIDGNAGDASLLDTLFQEHPITAVMHFAASVSVAESVSQPGLYYRNNSVNTLTLLERMTNAGINRLIFSSTAAVYGTAGADMQPLDEKTPPQPANPYGQSKLICEKIIFDYAATHGLKSAILRYFNVAGADRKGRTGLIADAATHLIKIAAETAVGKRDKLTVFGNDYPTPDGSAIRDYIHVDDLITAHIKALEYLKGGGETDIFNCGYSHGYSVLDVIAAIEKVTGEAIAYDIDARRPGDVASLTADSAKIRQAFDWQPEFDDLQTIIADSIRWEKTIP